MAIALRVDVPDRPAQRCALGAQPPQQHPQERQPRRKGRTHTRKADHYSGNILNPLGQANCIRVSMCHYNTEAEVAQFLQAMREITEEAAAILMHATALPERIGVIISQEAAAAAQAILAKAEEAAKSERDKMRAELKKEFGRLVTATTAQVTGKVLTDEDQRRINEEALAKVEG